MTKKYLFIADEMGTPGISAHTSNTFVFGGFVIEENEIEKGINIWRTIKRTVCDHEKAELKWKHFFVDENDSRFKIPLKIKSKKGRRQLAAFTLKCLFQQTPLKPLIAICRKDRATKAFIVKSRKGKDKIDYDVMWVGPIGMFSTFLALMGGKGELVFDKLSRNQERDRQDFWSGTLQKVLNREFPKGIQKNFQRLLAIDEKIRFLDSEQNELIQIAEFVCGVIWNAGEGDEAFLAEVQENYGRDAEHVGLGILHVG